MKKRVSNFLHLYNNNAKLTGSYCTKIVVDMLEVIPVRHGNHGGNNSSDGGNPNVAKATAMCVLFVCSLTLGLIPIKLTKWLMKKNKTKGPPDSNTYVQMLLGECLVQTCQNHHLSFVPIR